jgi:hypothetical protein
MSLSDFALLGIDAKLLALEKMKHDLVKMHCRGARPTPGVTATVERSADFAGAFCLGVLQRERPRKGSKNRSRDFGNEERTRQTFGGNKMPGNRKPLDLPPSFDFLFEVEPDLDTENDAISKFLEAASCAGSFSGMSSATAHQHVSNLREESQERTTKFEKRFGDAPHTQPGQTLQKSADSWKDLVTRASKITRDDNTVKAYDANGVLIGTRELTETL